MKFLGKKDKADAYKKPIIQHEVGTVQCFHKFECIFGTMNPSRWNTYVR